MRCGRHLHNWCCSASTLCLSLLMHQTYYKSMFMLMLAIDNVPGVHVQCPAILVSTFPSQVQQRGLLFCQFPFVEKYFPQSSCHTSIYIGNTIINLGNVIITQHTPAAILQQYWRLLVWRHS